MDNFHIETAQNVIIKQNVANISTRIRSFFIDVVIMAGYSLTFYLLLEKIGIPFNSDAYLLYILIGFPVIFYSLLFETLMNGQSPGKYFSKIRVTKLDGSKPTFSNYLIRWMLRIIDVSMGSGSIALLTILLNGKGQRLGDIAAGTTIISEKKQFSIQDTLNIDISEDYTPVFPQVTMLSDTDIQKIKVLFTTSKRKGNHKAIVQIYQKIISITDIQTELKPDEFIETIIKDYNYYTQQM